MQIIDKISRMLKMSNNRFSKLLLILLCGICLMVIVWPTGGTDGGEGKNDGAGAKVTTASGEADGEQTAGREDMYDSACNYSSYMEQRLQKVLESMDGISQVSVMITVKNSGEKVTVKDVDTSHSESDGSSQSSVTEQTVMADTAGDTAPYITGYIQPQVEGVVVCCHGAENADMSLKITNAVQALFDVPAHKIVILEAN